MLDLSRTELQVQTQIIAKHLNNHQDPHSETAMALNRACNLGSLAGCVAYAQVLAAAGLNQQGEWHATLCN